MVLVGLIRSNATYLLELGPKLEKHKILRERQFLKRAQCFEHNNHILTTREFEERQRYFVSLLQSDEFFAEKQQEDQDPLSQLSAMGSNDALMNMAKGNLMNYVPQTLIMAWVNYFFAGFIVMKLPFPLTQGFKSMLQQGIATPDLNVRYVLSISWYFVNLFGLRPVYLLIMGSAEAERLISQQQQQQLLPNIGGPGAPPVDKVFKAEAENIQILSHKLIFDGIVDRVLKERS